MKLEVEINREDYYDFNKFHFIKTKLKRTIIIGILSAFIVNLFLQNFNLGATLISSIACIIFYFIVYFFSIYRSLVNTKKIPQDNGTILGPKELEFTKDEILYKSESSQGSSNWSTIKNIQKGQNAFYLYTDTNMAIIVPKRYFKSEKEQQCFVNLAESKINIA